MPTISDLERLAALRESNAISDDEFAELKLKVLNGEPPEKHASAPAAATPKLNGEWKGYWGKVSVGFGLLGASGIAYLNWNRLPIEGTLLLIAVNPMCFIGFPLVLAADQKCSAAAKTGRRTKSAAHNCAVL